MIHYSFTTSFVINSSLPAVWKTLLDFPQWKSWWPGVKSLSVSAKKLSPILHLRIGFPFYSLALNLQITHIDTKKVIAFTTSGDLIGNGMFILNTKGESTEVIFDWNVATPKLWMNIVGALAKPIFEFSHNVVMRWFVEGLAKQLRTSASDVSYTVNKTPPVREEFTI